MDRLLYIPTEEYIDQNGVLRYEIPLEVVNLTHPNLPPQIRKILLTKQYYGQYLEDGLQTGHVKLDRWGVATFQSQATFASYLGFALEAYVVRKLNEPFSQAKNIAMLWCSNRMQNKREWFDAYTAIGTGLKNTESNYPSYYSRTDTSDVRFVRAFTNKKTKVSTLEPLNLNGTRAPAGIQIKAITGNERTEIIDPLLSGKYSSVLTMLKRPGNTSLHSYDVCMDLIKDLFRGHVIGLDDRNHLERSIRRPVLVGFDEYDIACYVDYIAHYFPNFSHPDPTLTAAANIEISRSCDNDIVGTDALTQNIIVEG
jgi:hypothetical protein